MRSFFLVVLLSVFLVLSCRQSNGAAEGKRVAIKDALDSIGIGSDVEVVQIDDSVYVSLILPSDRWYDKYTLSEIGGYLLSKSGYMNERIICFDFVVHGRSNEGGRFCLPHDAIGSTVVRFSNKRYKKMFEHMINSTNPDNIIYMGVGLNAFSNATSGKFNEKNIWNVIFKYSSMCDSNQYRSDFEKIIKVLEYKEFSVDTKPLHDLVGICQ